MNESNSTVDIDAQFELLVLYGVRSTINSKDYTSYVVCDYIHKLVDRLSDYALDKILQIIRFGECNLDEFERREWLHVANDIQNELKGRHEP